MSEKSSTRIVLLTGHYRMVGNIDLLPGARLTDFLEETHEFFALTDAEVWDFNGNKIASAEFMDVNRNQIEVITLDKYLTPGAKSGSGKK